MPDLEGYCLVFVFSNIFCMFILSQIFLANFSLSLQDLSSGYWLPFHLKKLIGLMQSSISILAFPVLWEFSSGNYYLCWLGGVFIISWCSLRLSDQGLCSSLSRVRKGDLVSIFFIWTSRFSLKICWSSCLSVPCRERTECTWVHLLLGPPFWWSMDQIS